MIPKSLEFIESITRESMPVIPHDYACVMVFYQNRVKGKKYDTDDAPVYVSNLSKKDTTRLLANVLSRELHGGVK